MNLKAFLVFNAIVALIFGLAFTLIPGQTTALYGADLGDGGIYTARLFGGALVAFAVLTWLVRDAGASAERRAIILALVVGDVIGLVASLLAQLGGVTNALGWSTVAIYLILTAGYGYHLFFAGEAQPIGEGA